jgi:hypothetical protein
MACWLLALTFVNLIGELDSLSILTGPRHYSNHVNRYLGNRQAE